MKFPFTHLIPNDKLTLDLTGLASELDIMTDQHLHSPLLDRYVVFKPKSFQEYFDHCIAGQELRIVSPEDVWWSSDLSLMTLKVECINGYEFRIEGAYVLKLIDNDISKKFAEKIEPFIYLLENLPDEQKKRIKQATKFLFE